MRFVLNCYNFCFFCYKNINAIFIIFYYFLSHNIQHFQLIKRQFYDKYVKYKNYNTQNIPCQIIRIQSCLIEPMIF